MKNKKKVLIFFFFITLFYIGLNSYKKFGLSVDEPETRMQAAQTAMFIVGKFYETFKIEIAPINYKFETGEKYIPLTFNFKEWTDYSLHGGVSFTLPVFIIERIFLDYFPKKNIWFLWHLINFLFFYISIIFFYLLTAKFFKNWKVGLLASLMLVLSPRIFTESFYNSKDIIFMSSFIIATYSLINVSKKSNFKNIIIHGFTTGFLIDIRILGIIFWLPTFVLIYKNYLKKKINQNKFLILLFFYILSCAFTIFLFWPELWLDIKVFFLTWNRLSKFTCGEELFMGKIIDNCNLPFSYIFIWISYTTPVIFLSLFILGFGFAILNQAFFWFEFLKNKNKFITDQKLHQLVFLFFLLTPIIAVIILNSTLYDGWRHLYFIYPFIIILASNGLIKIIKIADSILYKNFLFIIFFLLLIQILHWNIVNFPYGNVFFNSLAGKNLRDKFELDYWGLANREGLEYIVKNDKNEKIIIIQDSLSHLRVSLQMLNHEDSKRITIVDKAQLDLGSQMNNFKKDNESIYRINNYKKVENPYDETNYKNYKLYYKIISGNETILTIYKKLI
jgi:hypothetical protein